MKIYKLYLESGPRRKKTMVHVLELLGCIANGPTTEQALGRTPAAIRQFLRFLERHGENGDPTMEFQIEVEQHITEGVWLGNGDPSIVFEADLAPLSREELERYIQRLEWMQHDLESLVRGSDHAQMDEQPQPRGRSIQAILEHILESEYAYMYAFGRIEDLPGTGSIVRKRSGDLLDWIAHVRQLEIERLRSLDEKQRSEPFVHWKYVRTARKVIRRMLEHQWEHLVEIQERLLVDQ